MDGDRQFRLGRRIGIVANSDDYKGRPGASYPEVWFGACGGLTCFLAADNTRTALFDVRAHHHYTTGYRLYLDVAADPANGMKMMGDIAAAGAAKAPVQVTAHAGSVSRPSRFATAPKCSRRSEAMTPRRWAAGARYLVGRRIPGRGATRAGAG